MYSTAWSKTIHSRPHIALIFLYSVQHRGSKYCRFIQAYIQASYWKFFRLTGNSCDLLELSIFIKNLRERSTNEAKLLDSLALVTNENGGG
jgi:hypothetical protein